MNREQDGIALLQGDDFDAALHARALFGQHKFAAAEIPARLRQQHRHLQRECQLAIQILMQTVEVAGDVLQQQRRWPKLASIVTEFQIIDVPLRVSYLHFHPFVPLVCERHSVGVEHRPQVADKGRQRIVEVAILSLAKAMPRHMDMAAEMLLVRI